MCHTKCVISTGGRVVCGRSGETPVFCQVPHAVSPAGDRCSLGWRP